MHIEDKNHVLLITRYFSLMLHSSVYTDYTVGIIKDALYSKIDGFDIISGANEPLHILIKPNDENLNITEDIKQRIYDAIYNSLLEFFKNTIVETQILSFIEIHKKDSVESSYGIKYILDRIIFDNDIKIISLLVNIVDIDNMVELIL